MAEPDVNPLLPTEYSGKTKRVAMLTMIVVGLFVASTIIMCVVYGVGEYHGGYVIVAIALAILLATTSVLINAYRKDEFEENARLKFVTIAQALALIVLAAALLAAIYGPIAPDTFVLGGASNGASGIMLVNSDGQSIQLNDGGGCAPWSFPKRIDKGAKYSISIENSPSTLACNLNNQAGTLNTDTLKVQVSCQTLYTVGGRIAGLTKEGLKLSNNKNDFLDVTPDMQQFTFAQPLYDGTTWSVAIESLPSGQSCDFTSTSPKTGTINGASVTEISIQCIA